MNRIIYLLIISLVFTTSCKNTVEHSETVELISIRKNTIPKATPLSQLMKSVRLIPLETSDDCLMSSIFLIEFHDDRIYMINYPSKNGVQVFDTSGKHICSIGKEGKGPGEYTELLSFSVLSETNRIYLNDRGAKKISEYDLNGKFIKDMRTPVKPADLQFIGPNKYYIHYPQEYYMRLVDISGGKTKTFIPHINGYNGYGNAIYTQADHTFLYSPTYHDSIYSLGQDSLILKYVFDFGPHQWSGEDQMAELAKTRRMSYPQNRITLGSAFFDFGSFLHFTLLYEDHNNVYTIDPFLWMKTDDKLIKLDNSSDDILFCSSYNLVAISPGNEWVSYLDAYEIVENKNKILDNTAFKYSKETLRQIDQIKEDDNPVLVLYTLAQ